MKKKNTICKVLTMVAVSCAAGSLLASEPADPRLVVILEGNNLQGYPSTVPDIDGDGIDDDAFCFDGNVVDAKTDLVIGTGQECLAATAEGLNIATTTLHFPSGSLTVRGKISVWPVQWDPATNPDVDPNVGLVTGYFPGPGTNNIIASSGRFAGRTGRMRLSGAALDYGDGTANLNCVFIIDLD